MAISDVLEVGWIKIRGYNFPVLPQGRGNDETPDHLYTQQCVHGERAWGKAGGGSVSV